MFILLGCNGQHCIKIGGNYDGIEGNIEYCFDQKESKEAGRPILISETGRKLLAITESDAAKINKLTEKNMTKSSVLKASISKPPFGKLTDFLSP
jgi:hypothetical protein